MSPGGHLVTSAVAGTVAAALTGSPAFTAAVIAGGFLIDVDHVVDYVAFERQRDLRPGAFLRYYVEGRARLAVLFLHSYELFALLAAVAWWWPSPWLAGYLLGSGMHLFLDLWFNGRLVSRSLVPFYSFGYRLAHGFRSGTLLGPAEFAPAPPRFWTAFFDGARVGDALVRSGVRWSGSWSRSRPSC